MDATRDAAAGGVDCAAGLCGFRRQRRQGRGEGAALMLASGPWRIAALIFVFIWFFLGGIGHFVLTKTFTSVVPSWVPAPREMVWFTGVCEIAGAIALWIPKLRRIAGLALIALT